MTTRSTQSTTTKSPHSIPPKSKQKAYSNSSQYFFPKTSLHKRNTENPTKTLSVKQNNRPGAEKHNLPAIKSTVSSENQSKKKNNKTHKNESNPKNNDKIDETSMEDEDTVHLYPDSNLEENDEDRTLLPPNKMTQINVSNKSITRIILWNCLVIIINVTKTELYSMIINHCV